MQKYKKVLAVLLAGAMMVSVTACGGKSDKKEDTTQKKTESGGEVKATDTNAKSKDNDLVIAIEGTVTSMDPHNIPDTNAISATRGVYENLVQFDKDNKIIGQLAKSWEISDDSLTYTFHLNEGIKFHDGTDFNPAAVKTNYDRVVDKNNNLRTRRTFIVTNADETEKARVASIETPDDNTVVFKLTEAWSPFINKLTQFCIISPEALKQYGNDIMQHACGTGPYTIKEWKEGDHTTMNRNDAYWGKEKPTVDSVTIKEVPEAGSRTAMLQTGEADLVYPMPADQISAIEGTGDVNVNTTDSNIMRYVTLNMNLPELKDVKVRQAMNYAIDKEAYVKLMYAGYGSPATSVVPSIINGYKEQTLYKYDVKKAKSLMKEAGYEKGFKLTIWGDNSTQETKGMTFIKQQLEQIGITVDVLPMDPATVNDKINVPLDQSEVNMWYVNWSASDFTMDGSLRALLYSTMAPPVSANTPYYNNPEFDKALDEGLKTANLDEQAKIYEKVQKIAWDDAPWLFLGNDQIIYASKAYLSNVYVGPDGAINFATASLAK
ncbi:MAG: ABC transporter substrate-binding protein [Lachnospiraceae bacterium]